MLKKSISTISVIFVIALIWHTLHINYWISWIIFDYAYPPIDTMSSLDRKIAEEGKLDTTRLIVFYGYPVENHTVVTKDGYVLKIHRIPFGKKSKIRNGIPVLLQHGVLCSSSMWVQNRENSLGFVLAEKGYDVWMGNFRGNRYSRTHLTIKNSDKKFWHYGWDKLAKYDIPAMINYIRFKTGYDRVLTVGHSMGTTAIFAALATQPELNQKIAGLTALAPITNARYLPSMLRNIYGVIRIPLNIVKSLFDRALLPYTKQKDDVWVRLCTVSSPQICEFLAGALTGYNPFLQNKTRIPIYANHYFEGISVHIAYHWLDNVDQKYGMVGYDYGRKENFVEYRQAYPISFNISKVRVPVGLIYASNDAMATPIDVHLMARKFPNLIGKYLVPEPMISHLDFTQSIPGNYINLKVVECLRKIVKLNVLVQIRS